MSNPEPFDAWQPFKTVNALSPDIPKRGPDTISPAWALVGRLLYRGINLSVQNVAVQAEPQDALTDDDKASIQKYTPELLDMLGGSERKYVPLEEHAEQIRAQVLVYFGREPTAKETAEAVKQADKLAAWLGVAWCPPDTRKDFCERLESRIYDMGLLSVWWGLAGDMPALLGLLKRLRDMQDDAAQGQKVKAAIDNARKREDAEWHVVAQAIGNMEYQAKELNSPRLAEAAKVMRAMLTPDRMRPEALEKAGIKKNGDKGRDIKHRRERATEKVMVTLYQQGNYGKPHNAGLELADKAIEQAKRDGWTMSRKSAPQTLARWFRAADKKSGK